MKANEINQLIDSGLFNYGFRMSIEDFGSLDNIEPPLLNDLSTNEAIRAVKQYELKILGFYGQVNEQLLARGRKLTQTMGEMLVPTVGETMKYVEQYLNQGKQKLRKGEKLYKNFTRLHPAQQTTHMDSELIKAILTRRKAQSTLGNVNKSK